VQGGARQSGNRRADRGRCLPDACCARALERNPIKSPHPLIPAQSPGPSSGRNPAWVPLSRGRAMNDDSIVSNNAPEITQRDRASARPLNRRRGDIESARRLRVRA
jgi:hypothetical protein